MGSENEMESFSVKMVSWSEAESCLRAVREAVFMNEQRVPEELECDGLDSHCCHCLAVSDKGEAIGCGRMTQDAHIGRMAVLSAWRGKKVGTAILEVLLEEARKRAYPEVELSAQLHALPFYRRFNFEEEGEVYMDAGIPHQKMRLRF
jgi:predicted GNAT family N-acyltransferase